MRIHLLFEVYDFETQYIYQICVRTVSYCTCFCRHDLCSPNMVLLKNQKAGTLADLVHRGSKAVV